MQLLGCFTGGVVGGVIGALIWAGIAYGTGYEIGWIAWGVGVLVGIGARVGSRGADGFAPGALAALIALAAVAGGKFVTVNWMTNDIVKDAPAYEYSEQQLVSCIATQLVDEYSAAGKPLIWPEGVVPEEAALEEEFPPALWKDAAARVAGMTQEQKDAYRETLESEYQAAIASLRSEMTSSGFMASFSLFDLLWAVLAVGSAYRLASGDMGGDD